MPNAAASPDIPVQPVAWRPCHRLISTRFPTVGLYDQIADPADLEVVFAVEALTNPRIRQDLGQLSLVPPEDRVAGPGATLVMAAFTHLNPLGSRFSDGTWGVYYAADTLEAAVAEVGHHRAAFLRRTQEPAIDLDLRWIQAELFDKLHDLRSLREPLRAEHDPDDYAASQALARRLRAQGSNGIAYQSVRHEGGQCVAVFKPRALSNARQAGHLALHWDGQAISHWYEKGMPHDLRTV